MKKFIITEEEKNRILGMHEDHGYNSLNEQDIKTTKFPCFTSTSDPYNYNPKRGDTTGNYAPAKMDFLRMFQDNSIIVAWENNTIKQYVRNGNAAGPETKKGTWKCKANNSGVDVVMTDSVVKKQSQKPALKPSGTSTPNTNESSIGVNYQYNFEGDTKYIYGVKDGKWFGKNLANGKEFDLSNIKTTIANLNSQFPNALTQDSPVETNPAVTTTTTTTNVVPKKLTDMSSIELSIMQKNQPLDYKSAYDKLGAVEQKIVMNKLAVKK
jgi:hypothetical protein